MKTFAPGARLIADHLGRAGAAARRTDTFAIGAGGDNDAFARLEQLGSLVDGAERPRLVARTVVVSIGRAVVDIIGLREGQRLLPAWKFGPVRQTRAGPGIRVIAPQRSGN